MYPPIVQPQYGKPITPLRLPQIVPQLNPNLEYMRNQQMQKAYGFINDRLARSISESRPFQNYPLYTPDMQNFLYNYPQSLFYYRPIRYFYQRPVQLDAKNCFPHQKEIINQLQERDNKIRNMLDKKPVKYGIPKKMDDVIKAGEIVHYPKASLISTNELKKKEREYEEIKKKLEELGPEGMRRRRRRNRQLRNIMRKIVCFNDFLLSERAFAKAAKNLRRDHFMHIQAAKANINEIKNFMLRILKNIENFCVQFFGEKITIITENEKLLEDSVFVVKSFVHQLFNDLSSAFVNKDDIPQSIRTIFKEFIREKAQLAPGYLSTFEFNRLEFDVRCRLNNVNNERRSLIIGFLILYRTLICEIFKNYLTYFPKIREMGNPIQDILNQKIKRNRNDRVGMTRENMINNLHPQLQNEINKLKKGQDKSQKEINLINKFNGPDADTQLLYYKKRKMEIRNNLLFNFNFIMQVLDHIIRKAFENHPPKYNDYFKNKHLYNIMVFSPEVDRKRQLVTASDNSDDIEFMNGVYTPSQDCEAFLRDNQRWMHMYELNTLEFCNDFASKIMEDEILAKNQRGGVNINLYAVNKPNPPPPNINQQKENEENNNEGGDNVTNKSGAKSKKSGASLPKISSPNVNNNVSNEENKTKSNIGNTEEQPATLESQQGKNITSGGDNEDEEEDEKEQ